MKYVKHTLLIAIISLLLPVLASCKIGGNDGGGGSGGGSVDGTVDGAGGEVIYDKTTSLSLIFADTNISAEVRDEIINGIYRHLDPSRVSFYYGEVPDEEAAHEIIFGYSDRAISVKAYDLLQRYDYDKLGDVGYLAYARDGSLAFAYTDSFTYDHLEEFLLDFANEYFGESLSLPGGTVKRVKTNVLADIEAEDAERKAAAWTRVEAAAGAEVRAALEGLYSLYTPGVISWLANLYEPRVCVCTVRDENGNKVCQHPTDENGAPLCSGGGFYYSNSARNTVGYLPDIESTNQALSFLESSGMLATLGGTYENNIPSWMRNEIVGFVKGLQHPNGYFYHPQWAKEDTDARVDRRGRDLDWASSMLKRLGASPYYDTLTGLEGVGKPTPTALSGRLGLSAVTAVSSVIATTATYPHYMENGEAFAAYLAKLDINNNSTPSATRLPRRSTR